jgi:hypothetical protein
MLRSWGAKYLIIIVALALTLSAPVHLCAREAPKTTEAPETPPARCAGGYAFDPSRGECVACNRPCLTGHKGICSRGLMDCSGASPLCRPTVDPGRRIEICNGEDDDCDGAIDEGFDKDDDRYTTCSGDCNDRDPSIHPDSVERCNDRDDNCNGLIDDGFNIGSACTVGLGDCARKGRLLCSESGFESLCDARAGSPGKEVCDGRDNDCNGKVDDRLGEHTCGVGACRLTIPVCEGGKLTECKPGDPTAELCGDDIDNDCDGRIDEGFAELGGTCYEGVGACRNVGKFVCSEDGLSLMCSATPDEPRAEVCGNREDDDCDGVVDTDTPGLGDPCDNGMLGECMRAGEMVCDRAEGALACSAERIKPKKEVCDGKDNDCDGVVDNGVLNACGGCEKLPGAIGGACMVPGGDECATGLWRCKAEVPGTALCLLNTAVSDGKACASDNNQCTLDSCSGGSCMHPPAADGIACDDGDACTANDKCSAGRCASGKPLSCDDQNVCTEDSCNPKEGCLHKKIGAGKVNSCSGCGELAAAPGSPCVLKDNFGPCRVGQFGCNADGTIECIQITFGRSESCNGMDDDCDGEVDEGLGTTTCGIGACEVEVAMCQGGKPAKCVPGDPLPETCANMGVDDDCNGVPDDVAELGEKCPVPIGTCIVPGQRRCVGDAEKPICVPVKARYAEDDDGNGIANYCDQEGEIAPMGVEEVGVMLSQGEQLTGGSSSIFDLARTRAAMLPWQRVYGSIVINADSPDRALLLVSGRLGDEKGMAVLRAKDVTQESGPTIRTCRAAVGESPRLLLAIDGTQGAIAATDDGYLRYHKIASQIPSPSAGKLDCRLYGERLPIPAVRRIRTNRGETECRVERVEDVAILSEEPLRITGAVACRIKDRSILSRSRSAVIVDVISQGTDGSYRASQVPFFEATGDVSRAVVVPLGRGGGALFAAASIKGKTVVGICSRKDDGWKCDSEEARSVGSPVVFAQVIGARGGSVHVMAVSEDGKAFDVAVGPGGKWEIKKAGGVGGRGTVKNPAGGGGGGGTVNSAIMMPGQKGRPGVLLCARDSGISAARVSWTKEGNFKLFRVGKERLVPEAPEDDVYPGGKLSFGMPEALHVLPLKRFGGDDLFASYRITKGMKDVGTMGFLYMNSNEPPRGTITDIRVSGGVGRAKIAFTDPTGDKLTYRASIKAGHGGSLDHWIDGLERGVLRFSVKGDAAVGLWPIEITVVAADSGGQTGKVKAVVARDGTVESISESSGR